MRRYGIELDAYRAERARELAETVIQGSCLDVHCPAESFSLLYLNPPYDFEMGEGPSRRMEQVFLEFTYRWLRPGGVLIFVIPGERIADCSQILAFQFRDIGIYCLTEPECVRYRQVVILGVRRTRRERERMQDREIRQARQHLTELSRNVSEIPSLPSDPDCRYAVPESKAVSLVYRELPLDEIEDLLFKSPAYRQANHILFGNQATISGRPLAPLHGGHVDTIRRIADFMHCRFHV